MGTGEGEAEEEGAFSGSLQAEVSQKAARLNYAALHAKVRQPRWCPACTSNTHKEVCTTVGGSITKHRTVFSLIVAYHPLLTDQHQHNIYAFSCYCLAIGNNVVPSGQAY